MNTPDQQLIGPFGRYLIFAGTGVLVSALTLFVPFESMFSPTFANYARIGVFIALLAAVWFLYDVCPQKVVVSLGAVCWVAALILVYVRIARDW
jgi:hypothetical protein